MREVTSQTRKFLTWSLIMIMARNFHNLGQKHEIFVNSYIIIKKIFALLDQSTNIGEHTRRPGIQCWRHKERLLRPIHFVERGARGGGAGRCVQQQTPTVHTVIRQPVGGSAPFLLVGDGAAAERQISAVRLLLQASAQGMDELQCGGAKCVPIARMTACENTK